MRCVPPCALHKELFKEHGAHNSIISDQNPCGDDRRAKKGSNDNTQSSTNKSTHVPDDGSTTDGADVCNDCDDRSPPDRISKLALEEGGVQILGSMGHKVESRHQQNEIHEAEPMFLERRFGLF